MRNVTLVRTASILTFLYAAGHTAGMPWTPVRTETAQPVIDAMREVRFMTMGASRSYWDFYQGFGLAISALLLFQAILLWQIAPLSGKDVPGVRPIIAAQAVAFLVNLVIIARYIFFIPALFAGAIVLCLGVVLLRRPATEL